MSVNRIAELRAFADLMEKCDQGGGASQEIRELCDEVESLERAISAVLEQREEESLKAINAERMLEGIRKAFRDIAGEGR